MFYDAKTRYTCGFCKYRYFSNVPKDCPKCSRKLDPKVVESAYKVRYYMSYPGFEHTYFHKGKQCTGRSIPAEYVESLIDTELAKLHISDELFEVLRKRLIYLWEEKRKEVTQKKSKLRKETDRIQATIDRMLSEKWGGEGLSERNKEEIDRLVDEKRERINALENSLREIRDESEVEFDRAWESLNVLFRAKDVFKKDAPDSFEPRRRLLLSLCSNLYFNDGVITVEWKKPFDIVVSQGLTKKNPQTISEDSSIGVQWLPEQDSNL